jgi:hypothetical protein
MDGNARACTEAVGKEEENWPARAQAGRFGEWKLSLCGGEKTQNTKLWKNAHTDVCTIGRALVSCE